MRCKIAALQIVYLINYQLRQASAAAVQNMPIKHRFRFTVSKKQRDAQAIVRDTYPSMNLNNRSS